MRASPQEFSEGGGWGIHGDLGGDQRSPGPGVDSVEHFRLLAEHGRDLIYRYRLRPAPGYELMSPAVVDLTGYTPEEFYADPELGLKLMDPEDRPLLEWLMRDGPGAVDQPLLLRARRRDGSVIWLEQRDIPIHDEDGNLVALEGIARDVTERKRTEEELRESETHLRVLTQQLPAVLWSTDPDLRFTSSSGTGLVALKLRPNQVVGMTLYEYFGTHDPTFLPIAAHLRALRGESLSYEAEWSGRTFESHVEPLRGARGEVEGVIGVAFDVTERKLTEQRLRESEERFRLLVDSVKDYAISMLDPEGRVVSWNQGAERIRGYTAEEMIGESCARFFLPEDVAAGRPQALLARAAAEGRCEDEGWRVRKDGARYWADVVITALRDEDGKLRGFSNVARDMTERRRAEEALRRSGEGFRRASEVKSQFLAVMSHELRTPLSTMLISADMLRDPAFGPLTEATVQDLAAKILASGRHLLGLIDDLLDLSRIEAGQLDLAVVPTPVGPLLGEVRQTVAPMASDRGVLLHVPADVPGQVLADPLRLRQVLLNLLTNAIKFTDTGGRVWVELSYLGESAMISVRDTGVGIAPQDLDRIFQPFEKASITAAGAGLGLAIAQRLVELQGGMLQVASTVGAGTTFTVTVPRVQAGSPRAEPAAGERWEPSPAQQPVLVVEDDPALLDLTARVLEGAGFGVDRAVSVAEALATLARSNPALVLLDLSLGDANGLEVVRRVRDNPSTCHIPVVAVSAKAASGDVQRALAAGCDAHLAKPTGAQELLGVVREFLRRR
jgi:PAS domain S-box-containing protein